MGRALHQMRLALGRGFDKPPDWSNLCPPYEEESSDMNLVTILNLRLEDTTEDVIVNHLRFSGSVRPRYCALAVQSASESRLLLATEHPKSILDDYVAAGRYAILRYIEDVRTLSVAGTSLRSVQEAPAPQYRLNASNNINVEQYGMSHNRTYDVKGRPTTASGQQSEKDFEERLVMAQNSILMTGARRLGRNNNEEEPASERVPDMPDDIEGFHR